MMKKSLIAFACLGWILAASSVLAQEPEPAIRVRLSHPDQQLREVIGLFKEAKAHDPASALAAWKRASKEPNRLGKPLEALIASMNPGMAEELKTLEGAEVSIRFDPATGQPEWSAVLPKDDGTFAALATALVLSGGSTEAPMGDAAVDRLAGPGSALMAKVAGRTLLASNREGLKLAKDRLETPRTPFKIGKAESKGFNLSIEPGSLKGSKSIGLNRLEELLWPSNILNPRIAPVDFYLTLERQTLTALMLYFDPRPIPQAAIDPAWLDWIPEDRAMVGFVLSTDPAAKSWDTLFGLVDRLEKLDPARANLAPVQIRLDLLARVAGIRAQIDVLHHLKGVSGWVGSNGKAIDSALVALHLDDQAAAERVAAGVKPLPGSGPIPPAEAGQPRSLGQVDGRTLRISRIERAVILTWGEGALEASMLARDKPARKDSSRLRDLLASDAKPIFAGGLWPGRVPGVWPEGTPLAKAFAEAPPLVYQALSGPHMSILLVAIWPGLDATVKKFLDLIPLDPPPDH